MISFVRYIAVQHKFVAGSFAPTPPSTATSASIADALTAAGQRCFFTSAVEDDSRYGPYLDVVRGWRDVMMGGARTRPLMRVIDRVYRAASAILSEPVRNSCVARSRPRGLAQACGRHGRARHEEWPPWQIRPARSKSLFLSSAARWPASRTMSSREISTA